MAAYHTLAARDGVKHLGHTVADIVTYYAADKKACYENTDNRIYQIEPIERVWIEITCQQMLDEVDQMLQCKCGKCREDTDHETKYQNKLIV